MRAVVTRRVMDTVMAITMHLSDRRRKHDGSRDSGTVL